MSSIFVEIEQGAEDVLDFIKEKASEVEQFVVSLPSKAVLWLQQHQELETKTLNLISGLVSKAISGASKMDEVLQSIISEATDLLAKGGFTSLLENAWGIVQNYAQAIYNNFIAGLGKVVGSLGGASA